MGMAGLEISSGGRPTRDRCRLASPRLRVVLDTPIASARRPAADRRRRPTLDPGDGRREPTSMRTPLSSPPGVFGIRWPLFRQLSKLRQMSPPPDGPRNDLPVNADHYSTRHGRLCNPELAAASSCRVVCLVPICDAFVCAARAQMIEFEPVLPETEVTEYSGDMGDTLPQRRRGHALEGVSRHGRARAL
jgi:hypothetical protein